MIKFLKWSLLTIIVLLLSVFLFRGFLYRAFFNYKPIGQRPVYSVSNRVLMDYLDKEAASLHPDGVEDIIESSLQITTDCLAFREAKNDNDPNKLIHTKYAHCVGYSAFFSATCNYLLAKFGYAEKWTSAPRAAQIYFCGKNIHSVFESSFFRDHDFNVIENQQTGEKFYVDPTITEYFYVNYVTCRE